MWIALGAATLVLAVAIYDLTQRRHALLRNFPVIGHLRYVLESVGPELRQYIVTSNDEERPFSRDQRSWVYASAKNQNNYFGFGTDNDLETSQNHLILKHACTSSPEVGAAHDAASPGYVIPCSKTLGGARRRRQAFTPESLIYVSAMSYGSLSSTAVSALNRGVALAGGLHNTGEGGVSPYHEEGGALIWQLGTGYFGARNSDGTFSLERAIERCDQSPVRAIEFKLSQGAKPGRGGVLPGAKVTAEIGKIRGVPVGEDVISPAFHSEFSDPDELLDFVERVAEATGLPVGVKSAVGDTTFWEQLADLMVAEDRGIDFLTIDGGEGGTGAAPLVFTDHVALPFKTGFARVYRIFAERGLADSVVFMGAGRLGFPMQAAFAMALGCDMVGVAREAMLALGCIQAQRCHTGHCPTGVATQNSWLARGLDPRDKAARVASYLVALRKEMLWLSGAAGKMHPSQLTVDDFELIDGFYGAKSAREVFGYEGIR